eukprot:TRINITY_DN618_c0_g1_i6.p1 TRINITY_DN618_c0_g1~~TRINITY_DN618_c0_g1_i6.p1  ORF type:complete len:403 (-),score=98.80 TRINITY_DN618_c0_g1_i6:334-1542(-)
MKAQDAPPSSKARLRPRPPPDPSVLRPSIEISVTGMKQALACLENGTPEIRDYLLNECNVIYECKVCLNMFRSLANFISHKRSYCDSRAKEVFRMGDPEPESGSSHLYTTVAYIEPEPVDTLVPEPVWDLKDYSPSLNLLKEAGFLEEIQTLPHPMKKLKPNLASIVHSLKLKAKPQKAKPLPPAKKKPSLEPLKEPIVRLERITQTTCAMFQTVSTEQTILKTMGRAYVELEKLKKCPTVLMGPDGKIIQPDKKYNSLSSKESIKENMNTSHYHCPLCKFSLSKMNNVILHIHKVHGKSMKEALEYRSSIRNALHALDTFKKKRICEICKKSFHNSLGWRKHQRICRSEDRSNLKREEESIVDILKNQPIIVLNKVDSPNSSVGNMSRKLRKKDCFLQRQM